MGYPSPLPSPDPLRKICHGNMLPVWSFLLHRVRSDGTTSMARRRDLDDSEAQILAIHEHDLAEEEAGRLCNVTWRQHRELRTCMAKVAREAAEDERMESDSVVISLGEEDRGISSIQKPLLGDQIPEDGVAPYVPCKDIL